MKNIDGWLDGQKQNQMNGWKDKKNRWIVGWMEGYTIIYIYIFFNRWMVERKDKNMKKIDGWLDGQKKEHMKKMMECWMDRKIYEKQMDG